MKDDELTWEISGRQGNQETDAVFSLGFLCQLSTIIDLVRVQLPPRVFWYERDLQETNPKN